ncbi:MAG: hypothetical protein KJO33_07955, partial [Gammaproteobacteria bacterium]|nr:hypothetical protein [Gammaproteobacteria bacterium]
MSNTAKALKTEAPSAADRYPVRRLIEPSGKAVGDLPSVNDETLLQLFRHMVRTRTFDESALKLQRVGRIPAYYPCAGMETHVAVPAALEDR